MGASASLPRMKGDMAAAAAARAIGVAQDHLPYAPRKRGELVTVGQVIDGCLIGQLQFRSKGYWHSGVYVGVYEKTPTVVHFMANADGSPAVTGRGHIARSDLRVLVRDYDRVEWVPNNEDSRGPKSKEEIVCSALNFLEHPEEWMSGHGLNFKSLRKDNAYNVALQNCENFSLACVYNKPPLLSDQTKGYLKPLAGTTGVAVAAISNVARNQWHKQHEGRGGVAGS